MPAAQPWAIAAQVQVSNRFRRCWWDSSSSPAVKALLAWPAGAFPSTALPGLNALRTHPPSASAGAGPPIGFQAGAELPPHTIADSLLRTRLLSRACCHHYSGSPQGFARFTGDGDLPWFVWRVGSHIDAFEACSMFTHRQARGPLAQGPFSSVSSHGRLLTCPEASGWRAQGLDFTEIAAPWQGTHTNSVERASVRPVAYQQQLTRQRRRRRRTVYVMSVIETCKLIEVNPQSDHFTDLC